MNQLYKRKQKRKRINSKRKKERINMKVKENFFGGSPG